MVDLDNDGEDELVINGPYGGKYLDIKNNQIIEFAQGQGAALVLSYIYYEDAYWIVYSDTTHAGRTCYSFTKMFGTETIMDSFELNAYYWDQDQYDESSTFEYRGKEISMEEYEELINKIFTK